MDGENDDIPLSALQHYLFCPRQCALIHVERQWAEDAATVEGRILHERADQPGASRRRGVRSVRSLPLRCVRLGLSGIADVVEFRADAPPHPVEYKRGRPKAHRADEVQLCAQALCLEEMLAVSIPDGSLFYGEERRRTLVPFDADLRALTEDVATRVADMIRAGRTPPPDYSPKRCDRGSLNELCRPRRLSRPTDVAAWLKRRLAEDEDA